MSNTTTHDWIIARPGLLGGKPCVRGTRISVEFILERLAAGASPQEILLKYPQIQAEGLAAALRYAAQTLKNEIIWDVKISA